MFFDVGLKNTVNYSVFGHLTLKNHGICSGFCFSPRKNTVNNSNFAVFSCFSLFFELRWSAIHGYQILRVFFPTINTFGCFWSQWPTSLAVTSGREGVRTTSFKPWRPHRGSCRGATAIEENNGSRREQWLTSLTVWTIHSICTYMIYIYISLSIYRSIFLYLFWLADIFASVECPDNKSLHHRSTFRSAPESCPCCVSPTMRCGRLPSRSDVNIL